MVNSSPFKEQVSDIAARPPVPDRRSAPFRRRTPRGFALIVSLSRIKPGFFAVSPFKAAGFPVPSDAEPTPFSAVPSTAPEPFISPASLFPASFPDAPFSALPAPAFSAFTTFVPGKIVHHFQLGAQRVHLSCQNLFCRDRPSCPPNPVR